MSGPGLPGTICIQSVNMVECVQTLQLFQTRACVPCFNFFWWSWNPIWIKIAASSKTLHSTATACLITKQHSKFGIDMVKSCWKIGTECPSHKCFCKVSHIPWHAMKVYDLWWHSVYNFDEGAPYDIRLNETIGALNHYRPPLHVDHNRDTFLATIFDDKLASDSSMLEEAIRKRFGEHLSNLMKRVSEKHPATKPSVQSSGKRGWNTQDSVSATAKSSNVQAPKRVPKVP